MRLPCVNTPLPCDLARITRVDCKASGTWFTLSFRLFSCLVVLENKSGALQQPLQRADAVLQLHHWLMKAFGAARRECKLSYASGFHPFPGTSVP